MKRVLIYKLQSKDNLTSLAKYALEKKQLGLKSEHQGRTRGVKGGCYALVFALCTLAHIAEQFVEVVMCCMLSINQFNYKFHRSNIVFQ